MNDCLVTKLKGSVSNDNLEKLGVIKFKRTVSVPIETRFDVIAGKSCELSVEGDFTITDRSGTTSYGKSVTLSGDNNAYNITPDNRGTLSPVIIRISDYYSLSALVVYAAIYDGNTHFVKFMPNLTRLGIHGEAADVYDISELNSSLCSLLMYNVKLANLNSIKNFLGISVIRIGEYATSDEEISVEDICDGIYNSGAGKTSGTLTIQQDSLSNIIKFENSWLRTEKTISFSSQGWQVV